jgi:hypothetical protein
LQAGDALEGARDGHALALEEQLAREERPVQLGQREDTLAHAVFTACVEASGS